MAGIVGGPSFMEAMTPALRLMDEHSKLVDRTKTEGQQTTVVGNSTAVWEYRRNTGIGDEPFCHIVVDWINPGPDEPRKPRPGFCDENKIEHSWETGPMLASYPPIPTRVCVNCGKQQRLMPSQWVDSQ